VSRTGTTGGRRSSHPAVPAVDLRTRALSAADAEAGFRLSSEAGWNQTVADWRVMLRPGEGVGQVTASGELVASALVVPHGGRVGWIAMVLTTASQRRRGLATANLRWAIARCDELGLIAGLDATPEGREVYRPLGFIDLWGLERLTAKAPAIAASSPREFALRPMHEVDLDGVEALDARVFGASRRPLLAHLLADRPGQALAAERQGRIAGFALARSGRVALHLGPLVATDVGVAIALTAQALRGVIGPVSIDVPDTRSGFRDWLADAGFRPVRPFTRMLRGDGTDLGDPGQSFAIGGPEFG
jgi:GNAT superfamily N-acetyltransferase